MEAPIVPLRAPFAALLLACLAVGATAELDLDARNGDKVASTLDPASEVETFRIVCPEGAAITLKAKAAKGGPQLRVRLSDPSLAILAEEAGQKPAIKKAIAPATGSYTVDVWSSDGATTGAYSLTIAWKSPAKASGTADLGSADQATLTFAADAGAKAKFRAKPGKGNHAPASLVDITGPGGFTQSFAQAGGGEATLPFSGDYVLHYTNGAPDVGAVIASVKLTQPKSAKRSLRLGSASVPLNATALVAGVIGPGGGELGGPDDGPIAGASVSIPPGALGQATSILMGTAEPIVTALPGTPAGPAIFIGPEGLAFDNGLSATVTIPYDPELFPVDTSSLIVLTRDADGNLTQIAGAVVDPVAHTVTFTTSHFSAFAARRGFPVTEIARLVDADATADEDFGAAVGVAGDLIAVGAPLHDLNAATPQVGSVVTFKRSGAAWTQDATFLLPGPATGEGFGSSIAVGPNLVAAGAPTRRTKAGQPITGAVYTFERDKFGMWSPSGEIVPPNAQGGEFAGAAIAFEGSRLIVGAPGDSTAATNSGAAHVFVLDATGGWAYEARFIAPNPAAQQQFGSAVAISGDTALVAAPGAGTAGAVFVFRRVQGEWSADGAIFAPDAFKGQRFGFAAAIDAGTFAVTSDFHPTFGQGAGAVSVYPDSPPAFVRDAVLSSLDPVSAEDPAGDAFGFSIALRGDLIVAGAPVRDLLVAGEEPVVGAGQAFVLERTNGVWRTAARLRGTGADAFPIAAGDTFGRSVAFDGATIVVGATGEKSLPTADAGAVYVFSVGGP